MTFIRIPFYYFGAVYSSVVQHSPTMCKALRRILSNIGRGKNTKTKFLDLDI